MTKDITTPRRAMSRFLFVALIILLLTTLRLVHLEADTPPDLGTESLGIYVDEGYKTLSPRNLALFGDTKWHQGDDFPGWMDPGSPRPRYRYSPLTQWYFYLAFRLPGPDLRNVRLASILLFTLFLVGYAFAMVGTYSRSLLTLGFMLLGLQSSLFFCSRLALFVMPVVVCLYWMLFLVRRLESRPLHLTLGVILVFAVVMTFGIRSSAPVYVAPIALGVLISWGIKHRETDRGRLWITAGLAAVGVTLLASYTYPLWGRRLFEVDAYKNLLFNNLMNPLHVAATAVVVSGFLCACHILLTHPGQYLESSYRACLLVMVLIGPAPLSIFIYQPLRYYIPFLPAFLLLVLEWIHTRAWRRKIPNPVPGFIQALCLAILIGTLCCIAHGVNEQILKKLELILGNEPGLSNRAMRFYIIPLTLPIVSGLWIIKRRLFQGKTMAGLIACSLLIATLQDISSIGNFLAYPSYQSREISADLRGIVPEDGSIVGDWAPFFALGTDLKALFMNSRFNTPSRILAPRPSHFLFCETPQNLELMDDFGDVLETPVYVSSYMGRRVALHPLRW